MDPVAVEEETSKKGKTLHSVAELLKTNGPSSTIDYSDSYLVIWPFFTFSLAKLLFCWHV